MVTGLFPTEGRILRGYDFTATWPDTDDPNAEVNFRADWGTEVAQSFSAPARVVASTEFNRIEFNEIKTSLEYAMRIDQCSPARTGGFTNIGTNNNPIYILKTAPYDTDGTPALIWISEAVVSMERAHGQIWHEVRRESYVEGWRLVLTGALNTELGFATANDRHGVKGLVDQMTEAEPLEVMLALLNPERAKSLQDRQYLISKREFMGSSMSIPIIQQLLADRQLSRRHRSLKSWLTGVRHLGIISLCAISQDGKWIPYSARINYYVFDDDHLIVRLFFKLLRRDASSEHRMMLKHRKLQNQYQRWSSQARDILGGDEKWHIDFYPPDTTRVDITSFSQSEWEAMDLQLIGDGTNHEVRGSFIPR